MTRGTVTGRAFASSAFAYSGGSSYVLSVRVPVVALAVTVLCASLTAQRAGAVTHAAPTTVGTPHAAPPKPAQVANVARVAPVAPVEHHPDFDGDGYADLVAPAPNDNVGNGEHAGSLWIAYGGPHGASSSNRHQHFTESSIGHGATSATGDNFGWVTAWGDFNHDGYDDLAIGAPNTTVAGQSAAGEVVVLYGTPHGLDTTGAQVFTEATPGLGSTPALNDYFGLGLAAGDFNHDGYADLAVDAGGVSVHGVTRSGRVTELFGTKHGLSHAAPLLPRQFDESTPGVHGGLYQNDDWGRTLVSGDFNGDHYADLAIGAPKKTAGQVAGAGVVDVLYGSASGLTGDGAQTWTEDSSGMPSSSQPADAWGWSLAAADFNGDGRSDLVIGAPTKTDGVAAAGTATLMLGSAHGLTTSGATSYDLAGVATQNPNVDDEFALSLAAFDYDGDGRPDLAVGVPGRDINGHVNAGEVVLLHDVGGHLAFASVLTRDTAGIVGPSAPNEHFGVVLMPGDYSGNGADDLGVALPGYTVDTEPNAGGMQVFYGSASGLSSADGPIDAPALGGSAVQDADFGGVANPAGA